MEGDSSYQRPMRRLLSLFLIVAARTVGHAAPSLPPIVVTSGTGYVGTHLAILEDVNANLTPEQAIGSQGFRASVDSVPNLGVSTSAFWIKTDVLNRCQEDHLYLHVEHAEIEELDVYVVYGSGLMLLASSGQARHPGARFAIVPEFFVKVPLPRDRTSTILLRIASNKQIQVPVHLHTAASLAAAGTHKHLLIGGYIGIMLALALYNLFVFLSIRDRGYIIYVSYLLFVSLTQLAFWGIGQNYLWRGLPWLATKASIILTFATAIAAGEFMKYFINTRANAPRLHSGIKYFHYLFAVLIFIYLFVAPTVGYRIAQVAAGLFASYMFVTIWTVWRQGSRQAGYFLAAWSIFLLGTLVFSLKDMGTLPYNAITTLTMPLGSAIEGILLSFGLADRINVLRREKERSQTEALAMAQENERITRDQNAMLERKVQERTVALQESNDHLKRTQVQLVSAEKMASLGQLTAGIAHEINNPLNFISSNIPPLKRDLQELQEVLQAYRALPGDHQEVAKVHELGQRLGVEETMDEVAEILSSIEEGASRTSGIVRGLRTFSRLDEDDLKQADINEGIRSTLVVLGPQLRDELQVELELGAIPAVECYPGKLNQVFMNLLTNSIHAAKERHPGGGGQIRIITRIDGEQVRITIADNGNGIPAEQRERIFEPFFTTKAIGEGTGLGLSIVHSIVEKHHGIIEVESTVGEGTAMTISLPILQGTTAKRA